MIDFFHESGEDRQMMLYTLLMMKYSWQLKTSNQNKQKTHTKNTHKFDNSRCIFCFYTPNRARQTSQNKQLVI